MENSASPPDSSIANLLIEHSPAVTYTCRASGNYAATFISENVKSQLGYMPSDFTVDPDFWLNNIHPDDREYVLADLKKLFTHGYHVHEYRFQAADGQYLWLRDELKLIREKDGSPKAIVGFWIDISEQKNIENLLRESEQKFRGIFNSTTDAIMLLDESGFFDCNSATLEIFGCPSREEFIKNHPADLSPPAQEDGQVSFDAAKHRIEEAYRSGTSHFEWTHKRLNGEVFPAEVLLTCMHLGDRKVIEANVRDITERKKSELLLNRRYDDLQKANVDLKNAQAQLLQSEKMASIGQLAAGVAHEINNPVGYVSSNITSLKKYINEIFQLLNLYERSDDIIVDDGLKQEILVLKNSLDLDYLRKDVEELVDESQEGLTRVKQIVQDLKDFSHVDEAEWQYADLHKGLNSTLNIVHNELKYKADIVKEYGELPEIKCMVSQLNQVFMNLLVNASHSIEGRGIVYIRTGVEGDGWIWIEIEDTGKGIPEDQLSRIFEPFYTTKEVGKGTGLGLSLAYGIIEKHNGRIEVRSVLDKGTLFRIYLPTNNEHD